MGGLTEPVVGTSRLIKSPFSALARKKVQTLTGVGVGLKVRASVMLDTVVPHAVASPLMKPGAHIPSPAQPPPHGREGKE
jgi:hypothetical protein